MAAKRRRPEGPSKLKRTVAARLREVRKAADLIEAAVKGHDGWVRLTPVLIALEGAIRDLGLAVAVLDDEGEK